MPVATAPAVRASSPSPAGTAPTVSWSIEDLLDLARTTLGLEVAFVGRFEGDQRVIRNASTAVPLPVGVGFSEPREQTHCQRMVDGRMPSVVPDTRAQPVAAEVPAVEQLGISSFVGVPVLRADGSVYGSLCVVGLQAEPRLNDGHADVLRALSAAVSALAEREDGEQAEREQVLLRLRQLRARGGPQIAFQPILDTVSGRLRGHEALSRFPADLGGNPAEWFAAAASVGHGVELELEAVTRALESLPHTTGYISVNVSPAALTSGLLPAALTGADLSRVVLELTEHERIAEYSELDAALQPLRRAGALLAVDDTGSGYASLGHVLALAPDIIKLDLTLVRGIDRDTSRQALAAALVTFAERTSATLVAEGVETAEELECLRGLGMPAVQGYLLGRPGPLRPSA